MKIRHYVRFAGSMETHEQMVHPIAQPMRGRRRVIVQIVQHISHKPRPMQRIQLGGIGHIRKSVQEKVYIVYFKKAITISRNILKQISPLILVSHTQSGKSVKADSDAE